MRQRSKSKREVGGYFDAQLVERVRAAAAARKITVTDFVIEAYRNGLKRTMKDEG